MGGSRCKKAATLPNLAWMAGVVETKARIRRTNNLQRKTSQLILQLQSQHHHVVKRLGELTGVEIAVMAPRDIIIQDRRACAEHCPEAHIHVEASMPETARWAVTGACAAIVLHNLLPFFVQPQGVQLVIDEVVRNFPTDGRGRTAILKSMVRMAKMGYKMPPGLIEPAANAIEIAQANGINLDPVNDEPAPATKD